MHRKKTIWVWRIVNNDKILIFRWTIPLSHSNVEMVLILFITMQSRSRSYRWLENDRRRWRGSEEWEESCWQKKRQSSAVDERSAERDRSIWTKVPGLGRCQHSETSALDFNKWFLMDFRLPFRSISCSAVLVCFNLWLNQVISANSIMSPKLTVQNYQK